MRVLHISKYYHPFVGGTEKVARSCVRALQGAGKPGFEQVVFCFDHAEHSGRHSKDVVDRVDGVQVVRCKCEAKVASQSLSLSYGRRLRAVFQRFHPDVVVLHYPNPFATRYLLKLLQPDMKLVVFWHLDITKQKLLGKLFYKQNRALLKRADRLIAASPNYAEGSSWLRQAGEKCVIIPDSIEEATAERIDESLHVKDAEAGSLRDGRIAERVQELRRQYSGKILCLAVGRHVEYKGFRYLIEAAKYLDEQYEIVITGQGPLTEELKKQAQKMQEKVGAAERSNCAQVHFAGLISDEELQAYMQACDIFCFPSITRNEAFGIALAEAMYCGKPAVTFTIEGSGVNYVSLGGVTGIECPNRDSRAYAEAVRALAEDEELRARMGAAARARVKELFLYGQFAVRIRELFQNLESTV